MTRPHRLTPATSAFPLAVASLSAQSFTGSILGLVSDSCGAIMPAVTVTATNQHTGERRTVLTTESGQYTFRLSPGTYTVEAEAKGFKRYKRENIRRTLRRVHSL